MPTMTRRQFGAAAILGVAGTRAARADIPVTRPERFDLCGWQSPLKDQYDRGTCVAHAAVAALEAAYHRAGYGLLDLSEEFAATMNKMFWLSPFPPASAAAENKIIAGEGGNGTGYVHAMADGFAVPAEAVMPYREPYENQPGFSINDPRWKRQYSVGSFCLLPRRFNPVRLSRATYYGVESYEDIHARDPVAVEEALLAGREVVWGFLVSGRRPRGKVWQYDGPPQPKDGGHAVLIVGYDRTNASKPYLIIKNSWADEGWTFVSYEYLRRYGRRATTITAVSAPRRGWAELAALGRWYLEIDGRRGILDAYHLPGASRTTFAALGVLGADGKVRSDDRIGTFFEGGNPDKAFRVNGAVHADGFTLGIDWSNPNQGYAATPPGTRLAFTGADKNAMFGNEARAVRLKSAAAFGDAVVLDDLPEVRLP